MISDKETQGGAAIAASRLAEALINFGHEVTRIIGVRKEFRNQNPQWKVKFCNGFPFEDTFFQGLEKISWDIANTISGIVISKRLNKILNELKPDIINIHNIHGVHWTPEILLTCQKHAPIVWTLHDMWSFTGRCAYSYDCLKFIDGCNSSCPTYNEYPTLEPQNIFKSWNLRRKIFEKSPKLTAVTPSQWLTKEAKKGLWKTKNVFTIPNSIPLNIYKKMDKEKAKELLGISTEGITLLAAAENINSRRKGGHILTEAMNQIDDKPFTLITFGNGKISLKNKKIKLIQLGFINPEIKKVYAFNAADIYIHPAPVDNLPNVVMESIGCGTPAIGFSIGGVPDMVRPGETGWLAGSISPKNFANAIIHGINEIENGMDLSQKCLEIAKNEYCYMVQAMKYSKIFTEI